MLVRLCLFCVLLLLATAPVQAQQTPAVEFAFQVDRQGLDVAPGEALKNALHSNSRIGMHIEPVVQMDLDILTVFLHEGMITHVTQGKRDVRIAPGSDIQLVDGNETRPLRSPWEAIDHPTDFQGFEEPILGFDNPIISFRQALELDPVEVAAIDYGVVAIKTSRHTFPLEAGTSLEGWLGEGEVPAWALVMLVAPRRDAHGPVNVHPAVIPFEVKEGR